MAIRSLVKLGPKGNLYDITKAIYGAASAYADVATNDDRNDVDGKPVDTINYINTYVQAVGATADVIVELTEAYKLRNKDVKNGIKLLEAISKGSGNLEPILEAFKNIPNPTIRNIIKVTDLSNKTIGEQVEVLSDFYNRFDKAADKANIFGTRWLRLFSEGLGWIDIIITVTDIAWDGIFTEVEFQQAFLEAIFGDWVVEQTFNLETIVATDINPPPPGIIPPPDVTNPPARPGVEPAFEAFSERALFRQRQIEAIMEKIEAIVQAIDSMLPEEFPAGVTSLEEYFSQILTNAISAATEAINSLSFEELNKLQKVFDPLEKAVDVLEIVREAIQPILDFVGEATAPINRIIDQLEDALGITKLEQTIRNEIESILNEVTQPIRDAIQDAIDKILGPVFQTFQEVVEILIEVREEILDVFLNPPGVVGDLTGIKDDVLDDKSIAAGLNGNDLIILQLDSRFDDGYGGFGLGGEGNDTVIGTERNDVLSGGHGADLIQGLAGNDVLNGGNGNNTLEGGFGNDTLVGGLNEDLLIGGAGEDGLLGDEGNDTLDGGEGNDLLDGEGGDDLLESGAGNDVLFGGEGNDTLVAASGENTLHGESGLDTINTLGESSAIHTILDASAFLIGGSGKDIVSIGDAFSEGALIEEGVFFDAGSNKDVFITGNLHLTPLAAKLVNFETLRIETPAGEVKTLLTDTDSLRSFRELELSGEGAVTLDIEAGPLNLDGLFSDRPFLFNLDGLTPISNPQDGGLSLLAPVTIRLPEGGGTAIGQAASSLGLTFLGRSGNDNIVGGSGSDIIRGGLGSDTINGGTGDSGNRFQLDGAIGDIILGTPQELDGDVIRNLTNRVDRVRILSSEGEPATNYQFDFEEAQNDPPATIVTIWVGDDEANKTILGAFTLEGTYTKLTSIPGSFLDATGSQVSYVEIFNNNVPPTAVDDEIVTRYQGEGDEPLPIDPFSNDFDVDTPPNPDTGEVRRQIAREESINFLFSGDPNADVAFGKSIPTELGASLRYTETGIVYEAPEPTVVLSNYGIAPTSLFDLTTALPFFGRDRVLYKIYDKDGELSNTASIDILIRPDPVTLSDGNQTLPRVFIQEESTDGPPESVNLNLLGSLSSLGTYRSDLSGIPSPAVSSPNVLSVGTGNDYFDIRDPEPGSGAPLAYFGLSGDDVLDARGASRNLGLFGDEGADWVEGGSGNDFLSAGGITDVGPKSTLRLSLEEQTPVPLSPVNILLGGGGNNVFSASSGFSSLNSPAPDSEKQAFNTVYVLDGGAEIITGPTINTSQASSVSLSLNPQPAQGPSVLAARAFQDDLIVGFDHDDSLIIPFDLSQAKGDLVATGSRTDTRTYGGKDFTVTGIATGTGRKTTGLILTDEDLSELGLLGRSFDFLDDLFHETNFNFNSQSTARSNTVRLDENTTNATLRFSTTISPAFNGTPQIISYDISADPVVSDGGRSPTTRLSVSLESYDFATRLRAIGEPNISIVNKTTTRCLLRNPFTGNCEISVPVPAADVSASQVFGIEGRLTRNNSILDPSGVFLGSGVSFDIELDGQYRSDRFVLELVPMNAITSAPYISTGDPVGGSFTTSNGAAYSYLDASAIDSSSANAPYGLAIRYVSSAPETAADTAQVRRGQAITFDLLANDTDADADPLLLFDVLFDTPEQDQVMFDGNTANGELILQTDANTGLGTGVVTYIAAPDFMGDLSFTYIATDGEFESAEEVVNITVTGLPPALGDDLIVLAADEDLNDSGGSPDRFVLLATLGLNDVDPDGDSIDLNSFKIVDLKLINDGSTTPPDNTTNQINNSFQVSDLGNQQLGIFIPSSSSAFQFLQAAPASAEGVGGSRLRFSYTLDDSDGAGSSDPATVELLVAADFELSDKDLLSVQEDGSITIDLLSGRSGGYGDAEIVAVEILHLEDPLHNGTLPGTVTTYGSGIVFTPTADLFGVTASIRVTVADLLGSTDTINLLISIQPVEDEPEIRLIDTTDPSRLLTLEDTKTTGILQILDVDLTDAAPLPQQIGAFSTQAGGSFTLTTTENPGFYEFLYEPLENYAGPDRVEILLEPTTPGGPEQSVALAIDVSSVNDPPFFTTPDPDSTTTIAVGDSLLVDLLSDVDDVEGSLDTASLLVEAVTGSTALQVDLRSDGTLALTGLSSGDATVTYSIADEEGARTARSLSFHVNQPPEAVDDRIQIIGSFDPILIDPIANDIDIDGTINYVVGPDGLPEPIDLQQSENSEGGGNLLGTVSWSETDAAFRYLPPADLSSFGKTDVFVYEIIDEDGATSRASVLIDLIDPNSQTPTLRFGALSGNATVATAATESFLLSSADPANLIGSAAELDGDELLSFSPDDQIQITDLSFSERKITVVRDRAASPGAIQIDPLHPTVAQLFGSTPLDALTDAFIGDILVTIADNLKSTTLRFLGGFVGTFVAKEASGGGITLSYNPTAQGDGDLHVISNPDADIRGGDGNGSQIGSIGDDVIFTGKGIDTVEAGAGNDVILLGTEGSKTVRGGTGADLFLLKAIAQSPADGIPVFLEDFNPFEGDRIALAIPDYLNDDLTVIEAALSLQAIGSTYVLYGSPDPENPSEGTPLPIAAFPALSRFYYEILTGTNQSEVLTGSSGNDSILGLAGNDTLNGGAGNDILDPGTGVDVITAGSGDDRILLGGADPADQNEVGTTIDGGGGTTDTIELLSDILVADFDPLNVERIQTNGHAINGDGGNASSRSIDLSGLTSVDASGATTSTGVLVNAGPGTDSVTGTAQNDTLNGQDGNDSLNGGSGDDSLSGGAGNDTLNGGAGNDILDPGTGVDVITAGSGDDRILLGGTDPADQNEVGTTIDGGGGTADTIELLSAILVADFDPLNVERIQTNGHAINGDGGNASTRSIDLSGLTSVDASGATTSTGVLVNAGPGTDSVTGTAQNDTLNGQDGNDSLNGGSGDDSLSGGAGNDTLNGGAGNDILDPGTGVDVITAGSGDDRILLGGTDPADQNEVGTTIDGGGGTADTIELLSAILVADFDPLNVERIQTNSHAINGDGGNASTRSIDLSGLTSVDASGATTSTGVLVNAGPGTDSVTGTAQNDTLNGQDGNDSLNGGSGDDSLSGGAGNDTLNGGAGNDILDPGTGVDVITAGSGDDRILLGGTDPADQNEVGTTIDGGGGTADTIELLSDILVADFDPLNVERIQTNGHAINGDGGNASSRSIDLSGLTPLDASGTVSSSGVSVFAGPGFDTVTGTAQNDTLNGQDGNDSLNGGSGDDSLSGGAGNDTLNGGAGNDILDPGTGVDVITAGSGDDRILLGGTDPADQNEVGTTIDGGGGTADTIELLSDILVADFDPLNVERIQTNGHAINGDGGNASSRSIDLSGLTPLDASGATTSTGVLVNAGPGTDSVTGTAQNDTLNGGAGDDNLTGGAGNDTFLLIADTQAGTKTITDFNKGGNDWIQLSGFSFGVADPAMLSDQERRSALLAATVSSGGNTTITLGAIGGLGSIHLIGVQDLDFTGTEDFLFL